MTLTEQQRNEHTHALLHPHMSTEQLLKQMQKDEQMSDEEFFAFLMHHAVSAYR